MKPTTMKIHISSGVHSMTARLNSKIIQSLVRERHRSRTHSDARISRQGCDKGFHRMHTICPRPLGEAEKQLALGRCRQEDQEFELRTQSKTLSQKAIRSE